MAIGKDNECQWDTIAYLNQIQRESLNAEDQEAQERRATQFPDEFQSQHRLRRESEHQGLNVFEPQTMVADMHSTDEGASFMCKETNIISFVFLQSPRY